MTWEVVLGIIALFGFGVAVTTPIIKLNSTITKLTCVVDALAERVVRSEKRVEFFEQKFEKIGETVNDHERRIEFLERGDDGK